MKRPKVSAPRGETDRQALRVALLGASLSVRTLSKRVGISEKDLPRHLEHVAKSAVADGLRLVVLSAECRSCGFTFRERERYAAPSRCPECKSERVLPPRFSLTADAEAQAGESDESALGEGDAAQNAATQDDATPDDATQDDATQDDATPDGERSDAS